MKHPERKKAKSFDSPLRCRAFTDGVFGGKNGYKYSDLKKIEENFHPEKPEYSLYFGDLHGHSDLSDGRIDIDNYYRGLRDVAGLDFAALTDHDHGGVGKDELWVGSPSKWDLIKEKAKEYYAPGRFTTILAYERDSYPYYDNLVVYYNSHNGEMIRGERDGEFTEKELRAALKRDDLLLIPHDTYCITAGAALSRLDVSLLTPMIEMYSCGDSAEYFGNPINTFGQVRGGFWQDALIRGAKMGCIGGGDNHAGSGGRVLENEKYPMNYQGLTGVYAKENTLEGIFEAIKAKRTYAFMGEPFAVDFRINGHYMGEEIALSTEDDRCIFYEVNASSPVKSATVVKNNVDVIRFVGQNKNSMFDYVPENETDYYYLRVELLDGRFAWTSPIWVKRI